LRGGAQIHGWILAFSPLDDWKKLSDKLEASNIDFVIPPAIRFEGEPGEQRTMFFRDPSGNPIEIKGFADFDSVYAA